MGYHAMLLVLMLSSIAMTTVLAKVTAKTAVLGTGTSCKEILKADRDAPSGEYYIRRAGYQSVLVYCEMGLNGGGYTFLHPKSIVQMRDEDIQSLFTDPTTFLMRTMRSNGRQTYATLQQHSSFRSPLKVGLNQYTGYQSPLNQGPYLFFGFIPRSLAATRSTQGIRVNGQNLQFRNCDANGNSQLVLFPNFAEQPMRGSSSTQFCQSIFLQSRNNPSGRMMPVEYFMFTEMHFGGCGCFSNTNTIHDTVLAANIGFR